jgi:hypothetical protein
MSQKNLNIYDGQTLLARTIKIQLMHVGLEQSGTHHNLRKLTCSRHDIAEKLLNWC